MRSRVSEGLARPMLRMSPPAQKASPVPVMSRHRTLSSSSSTGILASRPALMPADMAFIDFGSLSRTIAMPSLRVTMSDS